MTDKTEWQKYYLIWRKFELKKNFVFPIVWYSFVSLPLLLIIHYFFSTSDITDVCIYFFVVLFGTIIYLQRSLRNTHRLLDYLLRKHFDDDE